MSNECSEPYVRHLLIENLGHYQMGIDPMAKWVHWRKDRDPQPGDILAVCDRPSWPSILVVARKQEASDA